MSMWFTMMACFCMIKTLKSAWFVVKQWPLLNIINNAYLYIIVFIYYSIINDDDDNMMKATIMF